MQTIGEPRILILQHRVYKIAFIRNDSLFRDATPLSTKMIIYLCENLSKIQITRNLFDLTNNAISISFEPFP